MVLAELTPERVWFVLVKGIRRAIGALKVERTAHKFMELLCGTIYSVGIAGMKAGVG